ncbi:hypothetical protein Sru01_61710 [Sphaerisporangium rufum]|uniref:Uncharacterized protein n=1 Tax=Sphaerisporangium rufum TaxID=1381558 RepID=A0A919R7T4_9ACTN|nr:hypothetical protein [Sphaerisporangium rufum]GII81189.1 hypothetical protein Sru01_61710 [Sphaerisporangium rufum]
MTIQAPGALPINTFGIPTVRETVTGEPELIYISGIPLKPWYIPGHGRLWVPIDNTGHAFTVFCRHIADVDELANDGRLVLVDGVTGSGKTSLIHKCVDHLHARLAEALGRPVDPAPRSPEDHWRPRERPAPGICIVDLSDRAEKVAYDDTGELRALDAINRTIFRHVVSGVRSHGHETPDLDRLVTDAADPVDDDHRPAHRLSELYERLSEVLRDRRLFALIVLPYIPLGTPDAHLRFVRGHLNFCERRIVFFAETTEPDLMENMAPTLPWDQRQLVTHLSIGPLRGNDWESFVQARLDLPGLPAAHVIIAPEALARITPENENPHGTVRGLQNDLYALGEIARLDGRDVISDADVIALAHQRLDDERMRRRPPASGQPGQKGPVE